MRSFAAQDSFDHIWFGQDTVQRQRLLFNESQRKLAVGNPNWSARARELAEEISEDQQIENEVNSEKELDPSAALSVVVVGGRIFRKLDPAGENLCNLEEWPQIEPIEIDSVVRSELGKTGRVQVTPEQAIAIEFEIFQYQRFAVISRE